MTKPLGVGCLHVYHPALSPHKRKALMKFPIVTVAMVSVALVYVFWGQTQESSERIRTSDLCLRRAPIGVGLE